MHNRVLLQSGVVVPDSLLCLCSSLLDYCAHEIFDTELYDVLKTAVEQTLVTKQRL